MQFLEVFKLLCKQHGITQKQALADMGFGVTSNQRWKTGEPSLESLHTIKGYFGVTADSILDTLFAAGGQNSINGNITGSAVVQGSSGSTISFNAAAQASNENHDAEQLTEQETELLRIFRSINMKGKTAVMSCAYTEEERQA